MKNLFRKNQVIITALAIMIAVAGYLNFAEEKGEETAETATYGELGDITDTTGMELGLTGKDDNVELSDTELSDMEFSDASLAEAENETEVGDAVLVNNTIGSDFFLLRGLTESRPERKIRKCSWKS